jgi:hypothetical protein
VDKISEIGSTMLNAFHFRRLKNFIETKKYCTVQEKKRENVNVLSGHSHASSDNVHTLFKNL